jgi:hypothetical protein
MSLLLALLALGGVYYFYTASSAASTKREGVDPAAKQLEAEALTARFYSALDAFLGDPNTMVVDPEIDAAKLRSRVEVLWAEADPNHLAEAALEARSFGALAATKDKSVALVVARANSLANIFQAKIESLTKQGKNLDAAFALIDQGKFSTKVADTATKNASLDVAMIDKAALAPVLFVPTAVALTSDSKSQPSLVGNYVTLDGIVLGDGEVFQVRPIGLVTDDVTGAKTDIAIGRVLSYSMSSPPEGTYFGEGTHVYIAKKV